MSEVILVSDFFKTDLTGGAELTLDSLISYKPEKVNLTKMHSHLVNSKFVEENTEKVWIIGNSINIPEKVKLLFCKLKLNYHVIEFDYKFCKYRSFKKHQAVEKKECDCHVDRLSKLSIAFLLYAKTRWFMSEEQKNIHINKISSLKKCNNKVLSSVFSRGDLDFLKNISENEKDDSYFILKSNNWIKGKNSCINYAKKNKLEYELIGGLPYHELLIKMSTKKGIIYMPEDNDTCPRLIIESYLLGCEQHMNDHVQHKDESWFNSGVEKCYEYLRERPNAFWEYMTNE